MFLFFYLSGLIVISVNTGYKYGMYQGFHFLGWGLLLLSLVYGAIALINYLNNGETFDEKDRL
jgi:hypothetical protein